MKKDNRLLILGLVFVLLSIVGAIASISWFQMRSFYVLLFMIVCLILQGMHFRLQQGVWFTAASCLTFVWWVSTYFHRAWGDSPFYSFVKILLYGCLVVVLLIPLLHRKRGRLKPLSDESRTIFYWWDWLTKRPSQQKINALYFDLGKKVDIDGSRPTD